MANSGGGLCGGTGTSSSASSSSFSSQRFYVEAQTAAIAAIASAASAGAVAQACALCHVSYKYQPSCKSPWDAQYFMNYCLLLLQSMSMMQLRHG